MWSSHWSASSARTVVSMRRAHGRQHCTFEWGLNQSATSLMPQELLHSNLISIAEIWIPNYPTLVGEAATEKTPMSNPVGPLLQTLAQRVLTNLDFIDDHVRICGGDQDRQPYTDTQLLISLLSVLVFPHERTPGALGRLVANYNGLSRVVTIRYPTAGAGRVEIAGSDGERETVEPASIRDLPKLLRNGIAHFNIGPIEWNGSFAGIRVWNKDESGQVTLVADLNFGELRPLARGILSDLAKSRSDLRLDDPPDPLETLGYKFSRTTNRSKAPRIIDHVWKRFLEAHSGDPSQAKTLVDRVLDEASRQIIAPRTPVQPE